MSRLKIIRTILPLLVVLTVINQVLAWTGNPSGAFNASTFVCSADEQRIVIGTPESGFFQTNDGGISWEIFNPWFPHTISGYFTLIAVDSAADTMFISALSNTDVTRKLAFTTNGGNSWDTYSEPVSLTDNSRRDVVIDDLNHQRVLLYNSRGISLSEDCGETWDIVNIDSLSYPAGAFFQDPFDPSTFWVTGFYTHLPSVNPELTNRFIRKSINGGLSWTSTFDSDLLLHGDDTVSGSLNCMIKLSNGNLLCGGYHRINDDMDATNQLLLSSDDGLTGNWYNGGLPEGFYPQFLMEDPEYSGVVYVAGMTVFGLYRSTDYGQTFVRCTNGLPAGLSKIDNVSSNNYNGKVYLSFYGNGVFSTSDGGESWARLPSPPIGGRSDFTVFENCIVTRNRGYVYKRYDLHTHNWYELNIPSYYPVLPAIFPIKMVDANTVISGMRLFDPANVNDYNILTIRSDDYGDSWYETSQHFNQQTSHYDIWHGETDARFYAIRRTLDGYRAIVSNDSGQTWVEKAIVADLSSNFPVIHQNEDYLYAHVSGFEEGIILRSSDEGESFQDINFPDNPNLMYLLDEDRLLVKVFVDNYRQRIYLYEEGQWSLQNEEENINGNIIWIAGETNLLMSYHVDQMGESYLLTSNNLGTSWQRQVLHIPYEEYKPFLGNLSYDPWRNLVWLSTGVGLCYISLFDLAVDDGAINLIPLEKDLLDNYPNPFNSSTKIRFTLRNSGDTKIHLYNLNGQLVNEIATGRYEAGIHEVYMDMTNYSSGTYFLKMITSDGVKTRKIHLVK